jgi:N,N'-diacetyllegionaminate synthase
MMLPKKFKIIAEIGQAHEGNIITLHSYIDAIAKTGVKTIKFQAHLSDFESSKFDKFRTKQKYSVYSSRKEYWKKMEFTKKQWIGIKKHCEKLGLFFLCSPFSIEAAKMLNKIGIKAWKIGSGEVSNFPMLEYIAKTKKPIILSSGMSDFKEIDDSIKLIKKYNKKILLMQCTSMYPCKDNLIGLNLIKEMKKRYNLPVGFSDHSGDITTSFSAITLGAEFLELHVIFDKSIDTFDTSSSVTLKDIEYLNKKFNRIKILSNSKMNKNKIIPKIKVMKKLFEKSIFLKKNLKKNHAIKFSDLSFKKPCVGVHAKDYRKILGKKLKNNVKKENPLKWSLLL